MDIPLDKVIPRALALAVVGYCLWPSMMAFNSKPKTKSPDKPPELSAALLSPAMPPTPTRDPFEQNTATPASALKKVIQPATKAAAVKGPQKPAGAADPTVKTARRAAAASRDRAMPTGKGANHSGGLTLEATCIVGDRRLAVINGRLYAPKETLSLPGLSATPCEVVSVLPYKVVLKCGENNMELTYPNVASKSASAGKKSSGKKAQSASKRASPARGGSTKKTRR
ncbi:MAG: hypothetical protein KKE86_05565 [Planctomycetes bacterium]|nr:hypothetical protein [Planctomycetota bacterium]MBU4398789.1 hypothetical protein [Planctomycetota bacterium]MCG2682663.1 hypothetical protein [Planctomycetales bacterium]